MRDRERETPAHGEGGREKAREGGGEVSRQSVSGREGHMLS